MGDHEQDPAYLREPEVQHVLGHFEEWTKWPELPKEFFGQEVKRPEDFRRIRIERLKEGDLGIISRYFAICLMHEYTARHIQIHYKEYREFMRLRHYLGDLVKEKGPTSDARREIMHNMIWTHGIINGLDQRDPHFSELSLSKVTECMEKINQPPLTFFEVSNIHPQEIWEGMNIAFR